MNIVRVFVPMLATTSVLNGPSNSSEEGVRVQRYPASSPIQRRTGGVVTPLLAIRTPLSPPENHIDQYRYASIRSRTQFRRRRNICFPCFT